jgi:hypothetical protein
VVGVACGVVNSAYTTFGQHMPMSLVGWLPATPMAAIAATELLRVPLAQNIATNRATFSRLLGVVALVAVSSLAVENWIFGLERIVTLRLAEVTEAKTAQKLAKDKIADAVSHTGNAEMRGKEQREELAQRLKDRQVTIDAITKSREGADATHRANLVTIRETCITTPKGDNCSRDRSKEEDRRYADEIAKLNAQRDAAQQEIIDTQNSLDAMTGSDRANADAGSSEITRLQKDLADANGKVVAATEANQIYRLASMWFGVAPEAVADAQFAEVRAFFTAFSAFIIAGAGSIAAFLGTSVDRYQGDARRTRLYQALRILVRRRRARIKEKPVEVPKYADRIVYIHVPVDPQTGHVTASPDHPTAAKDEAQPQLKVVAT